MLSVIFCTLSLRFSVGAEVRVRTGGNCCCFVFFLCFLFFVIFPPVFVFIPPSSLPSPSHAVMDQSMVAVTRAVNSHLIFGIFFYTQT